MSEVKLHVDTAESFFGHALDMARRFDRGERVQGEAHISFETMETFLKVLTPNRWSLLRTLRERGASSIRALAQALGRDYRGVHADVAVLLDAGLIERNEKGAVLVPWSRITAEMALDAAA